MKKHIPFLLTLAATLIISIQFVLNLRAGASAVKTPNQPASRQSRLSEQVSVRAAGRGNPWINLRDGRDLVSEHAGPLELQAVAGQDQATPLALASADFDEDGTPDLMTAHRGAQGAMLTFYRGNPDAIYPNSVKAKARKAAGRFTDAPFLSPGHLIVLETSPDFLGAGDFDGDGHSDIVAAARGGDSIHVLSGDGRGSFPRSKRIALAGRVTAMMAGEINRADGLADIVVGITGQSGPRVLIFDDIRGGTNARPESFALPFEAAEFAVGDFVDDKGIDLAIASGKELVVIRGRGAAQDKTRSRILRRQLPFTLRSVAAGNFTGSYRFELGLLSDDGRVHALTPGPKQARTLNKWKVEKLSKDRWPSATRLVRARVSSIPVDNLLVVDPIVGQLHIVTGGSQAMSVKLGTVSMDVEGEPVAALDMRLNSDALTDLVVLRKGETSPTLLMTAPMNIFAVVDPSDNGMGTLRQAIDDANTTAGADQIIFMIGSGPQTISLSSALPIVIETATIDATTQPGFSGTPIITLDGNGFQADGLVIAGASVARGFAIHNFDGVGILMPIAGRGESPSGGGNTIEGNFIGLDSSGTGGSGVTGDGVNSQTGGNMIGGPTSDARNVIALNGGDGVDLSDGDIVQGNFIGTDATGSIDLGNQGNGVLISGVGGCTIGGSQSEPNVISGNSTSGIEISGIDATGNTIINNLIGTQADGTSPLGNGGDGILINESAPNNVIGGTAPGQANTIANSGGDGISVTSGVGNTIRGNSIFSNSGLGIDLDPDGVTPNDAGDGDSGTNDLQNFPVLTNVETLKGSITIEGSFNSTSDSSFTLDFFASPSCDPSGNGEGAVYIGSANVTTDPMGDAVINVFFITAPVSDGDSITATATSSNGTGSTSEFSACAILGGGGACVTFDNDSGDGLWETGLNWSTDELPGPNNDVCIPSQFTVTIATDPQQVSSLTNDGTLIISGGSLFISAASTINNLTINDPGFLLLGAPLTVTGTLDLGNGDINGKSTINIQGGTLSGSGTVDANVINGGQVNPGGSPGVISISGDYTQTPAGVLNLEIGGFMPGAEHDQIIVSGAASFDGTLNLTLINSFSPNVGDMFFVLSYSSFTGSFANVNGLDIGGGKQFQLNFGPNNLTIEVVQGGTSDLAITKTDTPDPVAAGNNITYTIQVTNFGPDNAPALQLDEAVPANTTFQSIIAPAGWSCQTPPVGGTGSISCSKSLLPALTTDTFTVVVNVNPGTPDGTIITNTATISSTFFDPSQGDNSVTSTTTVSTPTCTITCPQNMTVSADPSQCGTVVSYTVPPGTVICGTITCSPPPGTFFPVGVTTVTCTPSLGTPCSFNVTVVDDVRPRITCPGNISTSTTTGTAIVDYVLASATDNCPGVTVICLPPSGTVFPLGTNTVNCSATDAAGNTSTCAFTVTVNDGRAPTINCPANVIAEATPGQCTATVNYPPPVVVDTTPGTTVVCTPPAGSIFPLGTTAVFCAATNQAGNRVSCGFSVTVNAPPLIRVTLEGGGTSLQPGPADPPLRQRNDAPAGCDCDSTFTIENTGCSSYTLTLSEIARIGADVESGRITNTNDSNIFSVRLVAADQSETRLNIGSQVSFAQGQRRTFRLVFNPVVPAFTGRTSNLSANDALPNPTTSRVVFSQAGATPLNVVIPINGRVSTDVRLLNPDNSRDNKRVIFTKSGNEFTISLAVFDSNLDVNRIRYEFLDGQGRVVDRAFDVEMTDAIRQSNIIRGQSFKVIQRFAGANSRSQITSIRVTVFDAGSNDSFTAQLQRGTTNGAALRPAFGEGTLLPPTLVVGRDSRKY